MAGYISGVSLMNMKVSFVGWTTSSKVIVRSIAAQRSEMPLSVHAQQINPPTCIPEAAELFGYDEHILIK